jgi:signal transduction histidine kinase
LNLLDNAVKYSRDRKDIRVAVTAGDGHVTLAVSDRGIGIPQEEQDRIFEKFARVETGLVHDVKGAGLGLSLVQMLVHAHHGRVEVTEHARRGQYVHHPVAGLGRGARVHTRMTLPPVGVPRHALDGGRRGEGRSAPGEGS